MNYLTNYYRNLCEQLQEKLNILEAQLNEGRVYTDPTTGKLKFTPDRGMMTPEQEEMFGGKKERKGLMKYVDSQMDNFRNSTQDQNTPSTDPRFHKVKKTGRDLDIPLIDGRSYFRAREAERAAQTSGETDEDIYAMRQTAADQGGIPQNMVDAPINRTEQMPDGTLIHSQTPARLQMKPKPGLQVKPKNPPFRPQGLGDNILKALDSVKAIPGVQAGEMAYGVVPKYGDAGMINSIDKVNKMKKLDQQQINLNRIPEQDRGVSDNVFNYINKKAVNLFSR